MKKQKGVIFMKHSVVTQCPEIPLSVQ